MDAAGCTHAALYWRLAYSGFSKHALTHFLLLFNTIFLYDIYIPPLGDKVAGGLRILYNRLL